jgi:hypothetical protein
MKKKDDKPAALDHVLYEMEMLVYALLALCRSDLSSSDRSGWLEVFATHARNLNEFFSAKAFGPAYMKVAHFITGPVLYRFDNELARRASAQVAHLTYDRERPEEKTPWAFEKHFTALRVAALEFLREVSRVESLVAYQHNRQRCSALLDILPRIEFEHDPTR